jgi:hypothetical protein
MPKKIISSNKNQNMFQTCVLDKKVQGNIITFLKLNTMIRNIKM